MHLPELTLEAIDAMLMIARLGSHLLQFSLSAEQLLSFNIQFRLFENIFDKY